MADCASSVVLLALLFVLLVNLVPGMPPVGLDPSWVQGTNVAAAERLKFGSEVVFTYGPYGSAITPFYHPGVRLLSLLGGTTYFAGIGAATLILLRRGWKRKLLVVALLPLVTVIAHADLVGALFLVAPLMMVMAFWVLMQGRESNPQSAPWRMWASTLIMCASLGLLPAAKVSSAVPVAAAVVVMCAIAALAGDRRLAIVVPLATGVSFVTLWLVAGQSITTIPGYIRWSIPISGGYSEAMSVRESGPQSPLATVTFALTVGVLGIILLTRARRRQRLLLLGMWLATSLVAFKEGFVRADAHVISAWPVLALGIVLMVWWDAPRSAVVPAVALALLHMHIVLGPFTMQEVVARYRAVPDEVHVVLRGDTSSDVLDRQYNESLAMNRKLTPLRTLRGTTDIYPMEASAIFSNRLPWSPRPVFQSYSAYTASLAELNAKHLLGRRAPKNVVFRFDSIDGRLMGLSDGPSWRPLLERYRPNGTALWGSYPQQLLIKRHTPVHLKLGEPHRAGAHLGSWIRVPRTTGREAVLARVDMRPTLLGRLRDATWRPPFVFISVRLSDGREREHRFLPRTARAEFMLSPHLDSSDSFGDLYGRSRALPRVTSFKIATDGPRDAWFWSDQFTVDMRVMKLPSK